MKKSISLINTKNLFFALIFATFIIVSIAVLTDKDIKFTGNVILENESANQTNQTINQTILNETLVNESIKYSSSISSSEDLTQEEVSFGIQSDFTIQSDTTNFFVFQIETTSNYQNFSFQTDNAVSLLVDWGDGGANDTYDGTALRSHNYSVAGVYNISIQGQASRISFYEGTPTLLIDILSPMSNGLTGITSAYQMFRGATNIINFTAQDWFDEVSGNVTDMSYMFYGATNFNQSLNNWNTSSVTSMQYMFMYATIFNSNISTWDTSRVIDMNGMFRAATYFNQPLNSWDVSKVLYMDVMFYYANSFNQSLNTWDTSSVTTMLYMFDNAISFNQDLSLWNVSSVTGMDEMFNEVKLSTTNYNSLLIGWNSLPFLQNNIIFDGGNSTYNSGEAAIARQNLIDNYNWTITDGGEITLITCNSCSDCNSKIAAANSSDTVYLNNSITNQVGTCIEFNGADNITFDCQNHSNFIQGDGTGTDYGIYLNDSSTNNTIENCNVSNFSYGIYLSSSSNNTLTNIISSSNSLQGFYLYSNSNSNILTNITSNLNSNAGIYLSSSSNNNLTNINANSNHDGFYLSSSSNNTLTNIISNSNSRWGFYLYSVPGNILTNVITEENSQSDFWFDTYSDADCNNLYLTNITGSGNRAIEFYNYSVTIENKELSELILCNADNSTINNVTIRGSDTLRNNMLSLVYTDNINISNINSSGNFYGIYSKSSSNNIFTNITANSNDYNFAFYLSSNNTLTNILSSFSTYYAFSIESSSNNILTNITANSNLDSGFYFSSSNNTIKNSYIKNNTNYGMYLDLGSQSNTIYNNIFNNTINYYNASIVTNYFNTSLQSSTNIINGSNIGGNYWGYPNGTGFSDTCTDANSDGICDTNYTIDSSNIDYLPLSYGISSCIPNYFEGSWQDYNATHQRKTFTADPVVIACSTTYYEYRIICIEDWTCTVWAGCDGTTETRTCTDNNICGTTTLKPAITQSCTVSSSTGSSGGGGGGSSSTTDPVTGISEVINETIVTNNITMSPNETTEIIVDDSSFGLTNISINVSEVIPGASVSITEVQNISQATLQLGVGSNFETFEAFSVEKNGFTNNQIDSVTLQFRVTRAWAEEKFGGLSGLAKYFVAMYKRETPQDDWQKVLTNLIGEDDTYYYYEAISDGFSIFIYGVHIDKMEEEAVTQGLITNDERTTEKIIEETSTKDKFIVIMAIVLGVSILILLILVIIYKVHYSKKSIEHKNLVKKTKAHK